MPTPTQQTRRPRGSGGIAYDKRRDLYRITWPRRGQTAGSDYVSGSRIDAERELRKRLNERDAAPGAKLDRRLTVAGWIESWLAGPVAGKSLGTQIRYADISRRLIVPAVGRIRLAELTSSDVERFRADLVAGRLQPARRRFDPGRPVGRARRGDEGPAASAHRDQRPDGRRARAEGAPAAGPADTGRAGRAAGRGRPGSRPVRGVRADDRPRPAVVRAARPAPWRPDRRPAGRRPEARVPDRRHVGGTEGRQRPPADAPAMGRGRARPAAAPGAGGADVHHASAYPARFDPRPVAIARPAPALHLARPAARLRDADRGDEQSGRGHGRHGPPGLPDVAAVHRAGRRR